jgi:hypothetical protein
MDEWMKSFRGLRDEELDLEFSRFDFDAGGFRDALCELEGPLGTLSYMIGNPRGDYDYAYVIRLVKRLTRELMIMSEREREIFYGKVPWYGD